MPEEKKIAEEVKPIVYEIGERTFTLKKLVLGQIQRLIKVLQDATDSKLSELMKQAEGQNTNAVMELLFSILSQEKVSELLAIVLVEKGVDLSEKKQTELQSFLENTLTMPEVMQMINDFFTVNGLGEVLSPPSQTTASKDTTDQ